MYIHISIYVHIFVSIGVSAMSADKHECPSQKIKRYRCSQAHPQRLLHLFSASLSLSILFICFPHLCLLVSLTYVYYLYFGC